MVKYEKDNRGKWRWQLKAANGVIIDASTQGYTRRTSAKRNFELVRQTMIELTPD